MQNPTLSRDIKNQKIADRRACPEPVEWALSPATPLHLWHRHSCLWLFLDRRACPELVEWVPSPATFQGLRCSCSTAPGSPANAVFAFAGVERPSAVALFYMKYRYQTLQTKDETSLATLLCDRKKNLQPSCLTFGDRSKIPPRCPERP